MIIILNNIPVIIITFSVIVIIINIVINVLRLSCDADPVIKIIIIVLIIIILPLANIAFVVIIIIIITVINVLRLSCDACPVIVIAALAPLSLHSKSLITRAFVIIIISICFRRHNLMTIIDYVIYKEHTYILLVMINNTIIVIAPLSLHSKSLITRAFVIIIIIIRRHRHNLMTIINYVIDKDHTYILLVMIHNTIIVIAPLSLTVNH